MTTNRADYHYNEQHKLNKLTNSSLITTIMSHSKTTCGYYQQADHSEMPLCFLYFHLVTSIERTRKKTHHEKQNNRYHYLKVITTDRNEIRVQVCTENKPIGQIYNEPENVKGDLRLVRTHTIKSTANLPPQTHTDAARILLYF